MPIAQIGKFAPVISPAQANNDQTIGRLSSTNRVCLCEVTLTILDRDDVMFGDDKFDEVFGVFSCGPLFACLDICVQQDM